MKPKEINNMIKIDGMIIQIIEIMKDNKLAMVGGTFGVDPINHWKYKIELPARYRHKKENKK